MEPESGGRGRAHLEAWAAENGYRLVSARRKVAALHSVWRSELPRVYAIEVVDSEGRRRSGIAKVGGYLLGVLTPRVTLRWR